MKVIFHPDFHQVYTSDPAAAEGRIEAIIQIIEKKVDFVTALPASREDIALVHSEDHINSVKNGGLYEIASLAAGGAIQAAEIGLSEPAFAVIRPPGHHASGDSCWGFCFFNNMAIAMKTMLHRGRVRNGYVLDIDMHFGDGTMNTIGHYQIFTVYNPVAHYREAYMDEVKREMDSCSADIIGISAGFDNHEADWGGVLKTEDYREIGKLVRDAARRNKGGYFAILEGGYNHIVLGYNAMALIEGMA
ncbi:MAG: histone deacetylase family protein [bacterium]|nr:histone deacetylase family protein [bacterium]